MDTCFLGQTGVRVSELVFGTMGFGWQADEEAAGKLFSMCRDAGVNTFDCADVYAKGRSETILGRLIAPCRNDVVLTSKAYFPTGEGPNDRGASRYHLVRAVEASLSRLGTDRIDIFFVHRFDERTALDETLRALDDLVRAGKILYPAVSNFSAWQTMKALAHCRSAGLAPIVAAQPMYNLAKRQAEVEILPMAQSESLAVFPYSPLGGGLLTGKYGASKRPDAGRLLDVPMYKTRYGANLNYEIADRFTAFCNERALSPVSTAIAWVKAHPGVTAPIIGTWNPEHLPAQLAATGIDMTESLYAEISALSPTPPPATDRNEETSAHNYGSR